MNIVHISTADISGGAAKATYALHQSLLKRGFHSRMLVGYKSSHDNEIEGVWFNRGIVRRGMNFLIGKIEEFTGMQYLIQPFRNTFLHHPWVKSADIIHLHNLHGNYFSLSILPKLNATKPLVWTLYDMWPMSDHCAYPVMWGCNIWKTGKGHCPSLFDYPPIRCDTGAYLWKHKKVVYEQCDISFVGPSQWMCKTARESLLIGHFPIHCIPQGIDTNFFSPGDKREARKMLGIPVDAEVIFMSAIPNAPRKGLEYFIEALKYLTRDPRPFILVVGSRGLFPKEVTSKFPMREMGYLHSAELFHTCFVASDISVLPTLADNLPLTILDSLSTGVPVVSFDVGGISEAVRTGETGYLARYKDAKDLAHGIDDLLKDPSRLKRIAHHARQLILSHYTLDQQVLWYEGLYSQVVNLRRQATGV